MTRWVGRLIFVNVAAFFVTQFMTPGMYSMFALRPDLIPLRPWTPVTYMFLHGGWMHIIFNMLMLYFFGPRLEARLGARNFLGLYLASGIGGALLSLLTPHAWIVGASGAIFGVLLGFARYWPREQIYIWGLLPIQARVLVVLTTVLSLWFGFTGTQSGVAHFAHLGGFAGGFLFLKWLEYRSPARRFKRKVEASTRRTSAGSGSDLKRWQQIRREEMHPVNREELDRVLAKIEDDGVGSLTADERAFLDRFSPG